jgi:dTDP-4-dehydrorhamnose 3,5-epimerase|nr:dTDP-4-dehydrorhamnose 3,5-epimerase [Desulfovibrio oxyclinae]
MKKEIDLLNVIETGLPGLLVIEPRVFADQRGFFLESYNRERFRAVGVNADFIQDNHAFSAEPGVLRGFHFQRPPAAQAKLVWVVAGKVLDVVVDLRVGSPTYGRTFTGELSGRNQRRMFIPKGFGHAYAVLEPGTHFMYKVDAPYAPDLEGGIAWDDPQLAVDWQNAFGEEGPILSAKDRELPGMTDFESPFSYEEKA